jgi:glycosyltransferase involved in cell wall biosynthesis
VDATRLALPNVYMLGNRPYETLPAYVQGFDVGIIPYVLNNWTRSVDPLKTLEYLAAGIPVVSLPLPELEKYAPPVRIGPGYDAFIAEVTSALAEPSTAAAGRRALAQQHTWERRARRFLEIVHELVPKVMS